MFGHFDLDRPFAAPSKRRQSDIALVGTHELTPTQKIETDKTYVRSRCTGHWHMPGRRFHSSSLNYAGKKVSDIIKPQRHVRTVLGDHVRGTCRRVAGAHLGGIAQRVARRPAYLRRQREAALVRTASAALRVADRAAHELARRRVAAVRRGAHAGIAVLARLDNAIAAHLQ